MPKKVRKSAGLEFEPCTIDLDGLPNNEKFAQVMVNVLLAAILLNETKLKLVEMISEFAQGDGVIQGTSAP